jgi:SAM-dependent methyltransferase
MTNSAEAIDRFYALLSEQGQLLLRKLANQDINENNELAISSRLRKEFPVQLVLDALTQHLLRQKALSKFSAAMQMYFTKSGLEQASSEIVAQHRAKRFQNLGSITDFCCGIGGDLIQLAKLSSVTAVDYDPLHLAMAKTNAAVTNVDYPTNFIESDVRDFSLDNFNGVFIDPARRTSEGRLKTGDSEPPISWCTDLVSKVPHIGIKAAPGVDHALFPNDWELEFIAIGKDLKEAVAWSPELKSTKRRATILPTGHTLTDSPGPPVPVQMPGDYLLDPNPAVTRAGLVEDLARQLNAWKIDEKIGFLSSDNPIKSPFGRTLKIIDSAPWNQKQIPSRLKKHDIGVVDIRRRGLAGDVDQFQKSLKLIGSRKATLVMTRVQEKPWALICIDA